VRNVNKKSRDGEKINLNVCQYCGHVYQPDFCYKDLYTTGEFSDKYRLNNIPSKEKIDQLDKTAYDRFNFYKEFIDNMDNVLEVGSSLGSFVNLFKMADIESTGLEPDNDYADFSQKLYGFKQSSALLENFKVEKKYDSIISFHVIEHVENPHIFIKKIFELLNIGGKLLIECPSYDVHKFGNLDNFIWKPHIHYFRLSSLYYLVSNYFNVREIGYRQGSLYIYGEKTGNSSFSKSVFFRKKIKSKVIYLFNALLGKITPKTVSIGKYLFIIFFEKKGSKYITEGLKKLQDLVKEFFYLYKEKNRKGKITISHVTHYFGNAGDTVLSKCVRDLFLKNKKDIKWKLEAVRDSVSESKIQKYNKSHGLIVGGGGLFLPDTNKNNISGWQWPCSVDVYKKIKPPIILFAVGFNYFKGQVPEPLFIDNLKYLSERSAFFGVRNLGSRDEIIKLVGDQFKERIVYQPCPTTIIRKIYDIPGKVKTKKIAYNIAFDRYERRFAGNMYAILDQIALSAKKLDKQGYEILLVCHVKDDMKFHISMDKYNVNYRIVSIRNFLPEEVIAFYNNIDVVIGMRGHSQMIPFGVNSCILTLGSHAKMKWFLEDIDALDWFIDISENSENLSETILSKFKQVYEDNYDETYKLLKAKQNYLYEITLNNLKVINSIIN